MKVFKLNKKFLNKISKEILNFPKNLSKEISSIEKLLIYLKKKKI